MNLCMFLIWQIDKKNKHAFLSVKGTLGPGTHGPPRKRAGPAPRAAGTPFGYQGTAPSAALSRLPPPPGTGRALKGPS